MKIGEKKKCSLNFLIFLSTHYFLCCSFLKNKTYTSCLEWLYAPLLSCLWFSFFSQYNYCISFRHNQTQKIKCLIVLSIFKEKRLANLWLNNAKPATNPQFISYVLQIFIFYCIAAPKNLISILHALLSYFYYIYNYEVIRIIWPNKA